MAGISLPRKGGIPGLAFRLMIPPRSNSRRAAGRNTLYIHFCFCWSIFWWIHLRSPHPPVPSPQLRPSEALFRMFQHQHVSSDGFCGAEGLRRCEIIGPHIPGDPSWWDFNTNEEKCQVAQHKEGEKSTRGGGLCGGWVERMNNFHSGGQRRFSRSF